MNNNISKNDFDILSHVKTVEASPYLYIRIQQRIINQQENYLKPSFAWVLSLSMGLLILLNVAVLSTRHQTEKEVNLVTSLELHTNNNLYQ